MIFDIMRVGFNPRAHAGRDIYSLKPSWRFTFQSTRPRGARRINPKNIASYEVSIHAPTRGATIIDYFPIINNGFNPRAHAGRDLSLYSRTPYWVVSIHAPTRGATVPQQPGSPQGGFNPRAHAGRDGYCLGHEQQDRVSIHAPTRGATAFA